MKHYLIFGQPCAGKGTMCDLLQTYYGFNHKSTGDMIRDHQKRGTRIGLLADKLGVGNGNFLPDRQVSEMIKGDFVAEYGSTKAGYLLDGYPRNIAQAKDIASFMHNRKEPFEALIYFKTERTVLLERMKKRAEELNRPDDNEETFKRRLQKYEDETAPIVDYFKGKGKVIEVDASGTIEEQFFKLRIAMGLDPIFSCIVATGKNNEIGLENKLLWHLPNDFKYFQSNTKGKCLIIGRKTYESLGRLDLPQRHIFVITRDENYQVAIDALDRSGMYKGSKDNVTVVHSIKEANEKSIEWSNQNGKNEVMVCGGEQIYRTYLENDMIKKVYRTVVDSEFEADAFFPELQALPITQVDNPKDEKHEYKYSFNEYLL